VSWSFAGRRVLVATSSYPFHRDDFHALFVHEMAAALVSRGAEVHVVTPTTPQSRSDVDRWDGVSIERFTYPGCRGRLAATGGDGLWQNVVGRPPRGLTLPGLLGAFVRAIRRAVDRQTPDLVITHWLVPTALATELALPAAGPRRIHLAHGSDVHLLGRVRGGDRLIRWLGRGGTVTATSTYMQQVLGETFGSQRPVLTPVGVRVPAEPVARSGPRPPRLCFMGRLVPGKGIGRLLDLAEIMDTPMSIAGSGGSRDELLASVRRRGLAVRVLPAVTGQAKARFLAEHDVFVFLPDPVPAGRFQDNLPVSILEAMASGMPVVATAVGAVPQLLESSGGGWLVEPDVEAVASLLRGLTPQEIHRAGQAAHRLASDFSWEASLDRLAGVLDFPPPPPPPPRGLLTFARWRDHHAADHGAHGAQGHRRIRPDPGAHPGGP
jgi:glycosyltransferase involved in cell wall biosynthesis